MAQNNPKNIKLGSARAARTPKSHLPPHFFLDCFDQFCDCFETCYGHPFVIRKRTVCETILGEILGGPRDPPGPGVPGPRALGPGSPEAHGSHEAHGSPEARALGPRGP